MAKRTSNRAARRLLNMGGKISNTRISCYGYPVADSHKPKALRTTYFYWVRRIGGAE